MRSDVLKLIKQEYVKDEYGISQASETERTVYCYVGGITRSEFFEAGRNGLNPEYVFKIFFDDYDGERLCEYDGKRYAIYRTYFERFGDYMELYAQREGGVNG